jgi:hypothetical protein
MKRKREMGSANEQVGLYSEEGRGEGDRKGEREKVREGRGYF